MLELTGNIEIICNNSNKILKQDGSVLSFKITETKDKLIGVERHYFARMEFDCHDQIVGIEFNIWEYPVGIIHHEDYRAIGCTVIEKPTFNLRFT